MPYSWSQVLQPPGPLCSNYGLSWSTSNFPLLTPPDLFGWTFTNTRLLCDAYATEANATVYLPDFFGGEVLNPSIIADQNRWDEFDLEGWSERNAKEKRWPELKAVAQVLRGKYEKVGVIGYCYGGWSLFRLGGRAEDGLVDCMCSFDFLLVPESLMMVERKH